MPFPLFYLSPAFFSSAPLSALAAFCPLQAEESASELRGENRLLQADIESLKSQLAAAARGEAGSPGPAEAFDDVRRAAGSGEFGGLGLCFCFLCVSYLNAPN